MLIPPSIVKYQVSKVNSWHTTALRVCRVAQVGLLGFYSQKEFERNPQQNSDCTALIPGSSAQPQREVEKGLKNAFTSELGTEEWEWQVTL
jgi:hypothetical protein